LLGLVAITQLGAVAVAQLGAVVVLAQLVTTLPRRLLGRRRPVLGLLGRRRLSLARGQGLAAALGTLRAPGVRALVAGLLASPRRALLAAGVRALGAQ